MNHILRTTIVFLCCLVASSVLAQEGDYSDRIEQLREAREQVEVSEKEALKMEILEIEKRLEAGEINSEEAQRLKQEAAEKRALNIEDRRQMIDREIALLERNAGEVAEVPEEEDNVEYIELDFGFGEGSWVHWKSDRDFKYDRRTYSDLVFAFGFNNAIIDGENLEDSPYRLGGSRFFEIGYGWRTRVFKNSNFMRINYGFSFQFNGLKPEGNQYFVRDNGETRLEEFEFDLEKSKFRMDNLVFPLHFEFGPSKFKEYEDRVRYSLHNQFRIGFGGYAGVNLGARQKLKYNENGDNRKDKLKGNYNTSDFIYGLSAYAGVEGVLLYVKYDLNPIFQDAAVEQRNISLGLRFDL